MGNNKKTNNSNPIISKNIRIRCPKKFKIGAYSVVDDFCYFSTQVKLGKFCHIGSSCTIAGGKKYCFTLGDFSSISSGVKIWCKSNDFVNDLVVLLPKFLTSNIINSIEGNIHISQYTGIGSNSVIMPNNNIPEGVVVGALSFVPSNFSFIPWSVYAGTPIRYIKPRNKIQVLKHVALIKQKINR